jgi:hypothetical protein
MVMRRQFLVINEANPVAQLIDQPSPSLKAKQYLIATPPLSSYAEPIRNNHPNRN